MSHICECCQRNASQEHSFICSECDASHTTEFDYDPTPEDEQSYAQAQGEDHTPHSEV